MKPGHLLQGCSYKMQHSGTEYGLLKFTRRVSQKSSALSQTALNESVVEQQRLECLM